VHKNYAEIVATLPHSMLTPTQEELPDLDDAVAHIESMDFSKVREKLCSKDPLLCRQWTALEVEIAVQYYKNFLFLNKKYLSEYPVLPPPLEVDEIWHHHILDTRAYTQDCNKIFGYYFHHYPYFGTRGPADRENLDIAFELVQTLHHQEFGYYMTKIWTD